MSESGEFPSERAARIVLWRADEQLRAWVIDIQGRSKFTTYVELATRFADGTLVGTIKSGHPSVFDRPPWLKITTLPGAGVRELVAAHRARVAEVPSTPAPLWTAIRSSPRSPRTRPWSPTRPSGA